MERGIFLLVHLNLPQKQKSVARDTVARKRVVLYAKMMLG
jgi:hypothetical protein